MDIVLRAIRSFVLLAVFLGVAGTFSARAATYPGKPSRKDFFSDEAHLLTPATSKAVNEICWPLWKEEKIPLYVVTIPSLVFHDAAGQTIEGYAYDLFNE